MAYVVDIMVVIAVVFGTMVHDLSIRIVTILRFYFQTSFVMVHSSCNTACEGGGGKIRVSL
jgi:hypothetical protein